MHDERTTAMLALLRATSRRWSDLRVDLAEYTPEQLLHNELGIHLFGDSVDQALEQAASEIARWSANGIRVLSPFSPEYPERLRAVHDYPPLLFAQGTLRESDAASVAVVGTRNPTEGALRFIDEFVPRLADEGAPVVSGLARGVDSAAMRASVRMGNRTIGVIGTGLNRSYPPENNALQMQIASQHLIISQFFPDAPPTKQSFPMRNHVMSAFSSMTVIVEASEQSGTRIQARAATQHARPLILSRAVYMKTQWAKDLVDRKLDVTVVGNADEAIDAIRAIRMREAGKHSWGDSVLAPVAR
jgi:DNA processing protein